MIVKRITKVEILLTVVFGIAVLSFKGCESALEHAFINGMCGNTILAESKSPAGQWKAVEFGRSCGATTSVTAKRSVEEHLKSSGLTYTILQPTFFMEVWRSPALGFDAANAKAQVYGSGANKISWISQDVAKFAVASVDNPEALNVLIELGGPEALSPMEVVRTFEELHGRKFDVQHVPEEALREQRESASDPLQQSFAGLMLNYCQGHTIDMRETLQKFPVQLTSVRDFAKATL